MTLPRFFTSPLAATAGVLCGFALLAIPLRQLTSAPPVAAVELQATSNAATVPAWLTLKLLAPAESVSVTTATGQTIWKLGETPAGDVETRTDLPLDHEGLDLTLSIEFAGPEVETAAFLTIAPDGLEEQTRHAIGSGSIDEPLRFTWHTE